VRDSISDKTLHRLDVQGFDHVPAAELAAVAPWLRLAFAGCAGLALIATATSSTPMLLGLAVIAATAGLSPVHPFDLIYNHGVRRMTGTGPLPRRGIPARAACAGGAAVLVLTAWLFSAGFTLAGYLVGFQLAAVATLVATTDICIPSILFRMVFGPPRPRTSDG